MSFGYFQGQEAQALAYFKRRVETESDPNVRSQIEELIKKLELLLDQQHKQSPAKPDSAMHNACSL